MRIIHFVDDQDRFWWGQSLGDGTARLLSGGLFEEPVLADTTVPITKLLAPLVPTNIFCIGLNYRAHAQETGSELSPYPVVFMKPTSTVANPGEAIRLPACSAHGPEVDYECELAVVIGKVTRNVPVEEALQYVLGYTCANDVSARHWQMHAGGGQWIRGKGFDTFCPLGPALITADEVPDPQTLALKTILNDETMQNSNTSDMIFSVAELISYLSQDTTLLPGTVILTGTPEGVGFTRKPPVLLKSGDQVVVEIERIGQLFNPVVEVSD